MFKKMISKEMEEIRLELDEAMVEFKGGILIRMSDFNARLERLEGATIETAEKLDALMRHLGVYASYKPNAYSIKERKGE